MYWTQLSMLLVASVLRINCQNTTQSQMNSTNPVNVVVVSLNNTTKEVSGPLNITTPLNNTALYNISANFTRLQNGTFVPRYILTNKILNETFEFREKILDNGTKIFEKIKKTETIEIVTRVPDNEEFVASDVLYKVYKMWTKLNKETLENKNSSVKGMLARTVDILKKKAMNKKISKNFRKLLNKLKATGLQLLTRGTDSEMKMYLLNLLRNVSTISPKAKIFPVERVDEVINNTFRSRISIRDKKDYNTVLKSIVRSILKNESNKTLLASIDEQCNKAVEIYDFKKKKDAKEHIMLNLLMRALSFLGRRLKFTSNVQFKPTLSQKPKEKTLKGQTKTYSHSKNANGLLKRTLTKKSKNNKKNNIKTIKRTSKIHKLRSGPIKFKFSFDSDDNSGSQDFEEKKTENESTEENENSDSSNEANNNDELRTAKQSNKKNQNKLEKNKQANVENQNEPTVTFKQTRKEVTSKQKNKEKPTPQQAEKKENKKNRKELDQKHKKGQTELITPNETNESNDNSQEANKAEEANNPDSDDEFSWKSYSYENKKSDKNTDSHSNKPYKENSDKTDEDSKQEEAADRKTNRIKQNRIDKKIKSERPNVESDNQDEDDNSNKKSTVLNGNTYEKNIPEEIDGLDSDNLNEPLKAVKTSKPNNYVYSDKSVKSHKPNIVTNESNDNSKKANKANNPDSDDEFSWKSYSYESKKSDKNTDSNLNKPYKDHSANTDEVSEQEEAADKKTKQNKSVKYHNPNIPDEGDTLYKTQNTYDFPNKFGASDKNSAKLINQTLEVIPANLLYEVLNKRSMDQTRLHSFSYLPLRVELQNLIGKVIGYQETKKRIRSLIRKGDIDALRRGEKNDVKNDLIRRILNMENGSHNNLVQISHLDPKVKKMYGNFEKDLLDTLDLHKALVPLNETKLKGINDVISMKQFCRTQPVTYYLMKTLLKELAYVVKGDEGCNPEQDACVKATEQIQHNLRKHDNLQQFNNYIRRKLYEINFASNTIINKSDKDIGKYRAYETFYRETGCEKIIPGKILKKIQEYRKLLAYLGVLKRYRREVVPCTMSKGKKIFFNRNPLKPNTVIYRQNQADKGYLIRLHEPHTLVDASIVTFISLQMKDCSRFKETVSTQRYINNGDPLPGVLRGYMTVVKLEFITQDQRDVKLQLELKENNRVSDTYNINLNVKGIDVKVDIVPNGQAAVKQANNGKLKWNVRDVRIERFELNPSVNEMQDVVGCSHLFIKGSCC